MPSSTPSIAELRAVTQADFVVGRPGAEHWAGRLYMRRVSPYLTRFLLATPLSANDVTALMIPTGLLAALVLSLSGVGPALGAAALVQLQLLLDCSDGEVARWRRTPSPAGIYLDRIAHVVTGAALFAALGVRADGGWHSLGGWTSVGLALAVLVLLAGAETQLVYVARAEAGNVREPGDDVFVSRSPAVRGLRRAAGLIPFVRAFRAVELTLLAVAAAIADAALGNLQATHVLALVLLGAAVVTAVGHFVVILSSDRLR
jgi:phosphatidylglycerophosphate synthase